MSKIRKYSFHNDGTPFLDNKGHWVKYDDHAAAEATIRDLRAELAGLEYIGELDGVPIHHDSAMKLICNLRVEVEEQAKSCGYKIAEIDLENEDLRAELAAWKLVVEEACARFADCVYGDLPGMIDLMRAENATLRLTGNPHAVNCDGLPEHEHIPIAFIRGQGCPVCIMKAELDKSATLLKLTEMVRNRAQDENAALKAELKEDTARMLAACERIWPESNGLNFGCDSWDQAADLAEGMKADLDLEQRRHNQTKINLHCKELDIVRYVKQGVDARKEIAAMKAEAARALEGVQWDCLPSDVYGTSALHALRKIADKGGSE